MIIIQQSTCQTAMLHLRSTVTQTSSCSRLQMGGQVCHWKHEVSYSIWRDEKPEMRAFHIYLSIAEQDNWAQRVSEYSI